MIKVKILNDLIKKEHLVPATAGSAAIDLRIVSKGITRILPGAQLSVGTGISISLEDSGKAAMILPRSGWGSRGLILGNSVGLIDSDYQGEIILVLLNRSKNIIELSPMERVAQLVVVPVIKPEYEIVQEFEATTARGEGGFGSTGSV